MSRMNVRSNFADTITRASIFTKDYKSVPVADKGWKEGEP